MTACCWKEQKMNSILIRKKNIWNQRVDSTHHQSLTPHKRQISSDFLKALGCAWLSLGCALDLLATGSWSRLFYWFPDGLSAPHCYPNHQTAPSITFGNVSQDVVFAVSFFYPSLWQAVQSQLIIPLSFSFFVLE